LKRVWLFDLDDTMHDAVAASMLGINAVCTAYVQRELPHARPGRCAAPAVLALLRATLLGLVRHHACRQRIFCTTPIVSSVEQRQRSLA
jgi:putative hydrolase of the HAD superfamily